MSTTVTYNGVSYSIPAVGDSAWGTNVSTYLTALATGSLTKAGGAFTLTADANFGTTYGLIAKYFKSQSSNIAATGILRLANAEGVTWRNAANNADLALTVSSGDLLQFNGLTLAPIATTLTASRAVVTDASSHLTSSATTSTEVGYLSGATGTTGSGNLVYATSPSLTTPALGTPASGTLTSCTGLPISTGVSGLGTGVATFLATPSSANLAAAITDETGSGALVFATSPTLTTPNLGTPSAATLTNATGLPVSTGLSGLGTGVATFLGTPSSANLAAAMTDETGSGALVFATSPTLVTPILGTPTSGTLTNCTGLPISSGVSGLGTGVATFLATPSSANLAAAITDETGSGALVFGTSPTISGPTISGTPTLSASWIPSADNTYSLGDSTHAFTNHYSRNLQLNGSTSGTLTMTVPATVTSHTLIWPSAQGGSSTVLTNNGSGTLSWGAALTTTLASANIFVGNGSNVATAVAMSGDISIDNTGATAIGAGKIVNSQVNASAAIAYSKLNLSGSIVNADINSSAAIAGSKIQAASSSNTGTLSYYDTGTAYSGTFTMNSSTNASASVTITYTRIGDVVFLKFPPITATANGSDTALVATSSGAIISSLRPGTDRFFVCGLGRAAGSLTAGPCMIRINSDGTMAIYKDGTAGSSTFGAGTSGLDSAIGINYKI